MVVNLIVPLSSLTIESRNILSRLNKKKVLPIKGSDNVISNIYRDWRGLALLANIPMEIQARLNECHGKTDKVLKIWENLDYETAMVARLFDYLQLLDRYDVYEDLLVLARDNKLVE